MPEKRHRKGFIGFISRVNRKWSKSPQNLANKANLAYKIAGLRKRQDPAEKAFYPDLTPARQLRCGGRILMAGISPLASRPHALSGFASANILPDRPPSPLPRSKWYNTT